MQTLETHIKGKKDRTCCVDYACKFGSYIELVLRDNEVVGKKFPNNFWTKGFRGLTITDEDVKDEMAVSDNAAAAGDNMDLQANGDLPSLDCDEVVGAANTDTNSTGIIKETTKLVSALSAAANIKRSVDHSGDGAKKKAKLTPNKNRN